MTKEDKAEMLRRLDTKLTSLSNKAAEAKDRDVSVALLFVARACDEVATELEAARLSAPDEGVQCDYCNGKGWCGGMGADFTCPECNGTGKIPQSPPPAGDEVVVKRELAERLASLDGDVSDDAVREF